MYFRAKVAVMQLVVAPGYQQVGRWFDSRYFPWSFSLTYYFRHTLVLRLTKSVTG